jgi:hypothetical protein
LIRPEKTNNYNNINLNKTLMKKLFLLFTLLCATVALQAQVISGYKVQATQGTYTAITGGTVMDTTGMADDMLEKVWFPDSISSEVTKKAIPVVSITVPPVIAV